MLKDMPDNVAVKKWLLRLGVGGLVVMWLYFFSIPTVFTPSWYMGEKLMSDGIKKFQGLTINEYASSVQWGSAWKKETTISNEELLRLTKHFPKGARMDALVSAYSGISIFQDPLSDRYVFSYRKEAVLFKNDGTVVDSFDLPKASDENTGGYVHFFGNGLIYQAIDFSEKSSRPKIFYRGFSDSQWNKMKNSKQMLLSHDNSSNDEKFIVHPKNTNYSLRGYCLKRGGFDNHWFGGGEQDVTWDKSCVDWGVTLMRSDGTMRDLLNIHTDIDSRAHLYFGWDDSNFYVKLGEEEDTTLFGEVINVSAKEGDTSYIIPLSIL